MLKILDKIENAVSKIVGIVLILIISLLAICCILQVFTRFVLNNSLTWTEELARYCFIWGGVLGISLAFKEKTHARILAVYDKFPAKIRLVLEGVANLLAIYMAVLMVKYGGYMTMHALTNYSPQLQIPLGWVYACVPVTGVIILFFMLTSFIRYISQRKSGGEVE